MRRKMVWPLAVYLGQIPILVGCVVGLIPLHPIALVLPAVVLLTARVERRG